MCRKCDEPDFSIDDGEVDYKRYECEMCGEYGPYFGVLMVDMMEACFLPPLRLCEPCVLQKVTQNNVIYQMFQRVDDPDYSSYDYDWNPTYYDSDWDGFIEADLERGFRARA
jgi:hypothetical protein